MVIVVMRFMNIQIPAPTLESTLCAQTTAATSSAVTTPATTVTSTAAVGTNGTADDEVDVVDLDLSLVEEIECLHPSMNTMTKLIHEDLPLSPPYINLGMPKAGSSTLYQFFRCNNVRANHWKLYNKESDYVGGCIHKAVQAGLPPLKTCDPTVQAWMQLDVIRPSDNAKNHMCFFPQQQYLEELHAEAPNATFLLMFRPLKHWVKSINNWRSERIENARSMGERLTLCDLPGLPFGKGSDLEDYARWFCRQVTYVRDFVKKYPSHSLVEINLYDDNAALMAKLFDAPETCWGHANVNQRLHNGTKSQKTGTK